jgi:hypothetical protein
MQSFLADVRLVLEVEPSAELFFEAFVEVSLPCIDCCRDDRTVFLRRSPEPSECCPTGHPYRGELHRIHQDRRGSIARVRYRFTFSYAPFQDEVYGFPSELALHWARVSGTVLCKRCGRRTPWSLQNNLVFPLDQVCPCGLVFARARVPQPLFRIQNLWQ